MQTKVIQLRLKHAVHWERVSGTGRVRGWAERVGKTAIQIERSDRFGQDGHGMERDAAL